MVHDTLEELRRIGTATDGVDHSQAEGICHLGASYRWPRPEHLPLSIRLHRGLLSTNVIAHESTHAAAELTFADCLTGWDARARTYLRAGFEPLAYAAGEITQRIVAECYRQRLIAR